MTLGARVTAVYTVLNRAEWALARAARGEGALAGKFRHPAVAPHLRALQRQFPHIEALVEGLVVSVSFGDLDIDGWSVVWAGVRRRR